MRRGQKTARGGRGEAVSQRRAARIVMRSQDNDFSVKKLKWQHIYDLVQKCLKNNVPEFLQNTFKFNQEEQDKVRVPRVRTEAAKKFFYYNGCIV